MYRAALATLACLASVPCMAGTAIEGPSAATPGKPTIDPGKLSVNEDAVKRAQAATDARDKAWDAKLRKTMGGVCKGC